MLIYSNQYHHRYRLHCHRCPFSSSSSSSSNSSCGSSSSSANRNSTSLSDLHMSSCIIYLDVLSHSNQERSAGTKSASLRTCRPTVTSARSPLTASGRLTTWPSLWSVRSRSSSPRARQTSIQNARWAKLWRSRMPVGQDFEDPECQVSKTLRIQNARWARLWRSRMPGEQEFEDPEYPASKSLKTR